MRYSAHLTPPQLPTTPRSPRGSPRSMSPPALGETGLIHPSCHSPRLLRRQYSVQPTPSLSSGKSLSQVSQSNDRHALTMSPFTYTPSTSVTSAGSSALRPPNFALRPPSPCSQISRSPSFDRRSASSVNGLAASPSTPSPSSLGRQSYSAPAYGDISPFHLPPHVYSEPMNRNSWHSGASMNGAQANSTQVPIESEVPEKASERCKTYCRELIAFLFSHLGLCLLLIGYMLMGAAIFQELESEGGQFESPQKAAELTNETLSKLFTKVQQLSVYADEAILEYQLVQEMNVVLSEFTRKMVETIDEGYDPNALPGMNKGNKWDFFGAFLYSLTIITTIGYGHIAPSRSETRIVTIVYAIFGIPLMLLYLTNIGGILAQSFRYIYTRLTYILCSRKMRQKQLERRRTMRRKLQHKSLSNPPFLNSNLPPVQRSFGISGSTHSLQYIPSRRWQEGKRQDLNKDLERASTSTRRWERRENFEKVHVPITLCLLILIAYVAGGGLVFANWENWSHIEGAYFCFITLSTIGFGDYVPGKYVNKQVNFIMCSIYILVGLALIAMCFNLMQEGVKHKFRTLVRKIGIIKDKYAIKRNDSSESDESDDDDF